MLDIEKKAGIGSRRARMVKKKWSEFNCLHTGCIGFCLQDKVNQGMRKKCVRPQLVLNAAAKWRKCYFVLGLDCPTDGAGLLSP